MTRNDLAVHMMMRNVALQDGRTAKKDAEKGLLVTESESSREDWLPPTIDDERTCSRCYVSDGCMLFKKVIVFLASAF